MKLRRSFTLLELIIVVIIVGILASISLPIYTKTKEKAFDQEAIANLKLMQAAEKIYRMETGGYYGPTSNISEINIKLKLALPSGVNRNWNYACASSGCVQASRTGASGGSFRQWSLTIIQEEPQGGIPCPAGGGG